MADVVIDHNAIMDEFVTLVKADKTLFDQAKPSKKLFRKVFKGGTDYDMDDDTMPYCYIQIADEFESTPEQFGTEFSGINMSTASYNVVVVDFKKDTRVAQEQLLVLLEGVRKVLVANPTLNGKITRMNISKARQKTNKKNAEKLAYTFVLGVTIGAEFNAVFPAPIGTVNLLSWPLDSIEQTHDDDALDDGITAVSPKNDIDRIDIEIEFNLTRRSQFKQIIRDADEISVTLNNGSDSLPLTVLPVSISKPVPFDQYQRAVVGLRIIN